MPSHYYTPPPLPQGTIPPRRFVIPETPDITGDVVLARPSLLAVYNLHFYNEEVISYRTTYSRIVALIPPDPGAGDAPIPNSSLNANLINIVTQHYNVYIPLPRQLPPFLAALVPEPPNPNLLLDPQRELNRKIIFSYYPIREEAFYNVYKSYLAKKSVIREELPFIPFGRIVAFQPNAFQSTYPGELYAFQTQERFIAFTKLGQSTLSIDELIHIVLGPLMKEYRRGTAIAINAETYDPAQTPSILINPSGGVTINLIAPSGTLVLSDQALGRISTGTFRFIYQTSLAHEIGVYLIEATSVNAGNTSKSIQQMSFRLVP